MADLDRQNRSPKVERLPDLRLRVTRLLDVLNNVPKTPAGIAAAGMWLPWATADEEFTSCRLISQNVSGQEGLFREPCEEPPKLVRIFEEIPANDRVQVGEPGVSFDQYGRKTVAIDYVQFSAGTTVYTPMVGTTAAPSPFTDCIMQKVEATDDGTLIRSREFFIDAGQLSDNEILRFNGKLKIRELTYLNQVPPTPSGYTLITRSTEFIAGLPVYKYGFANGATASGNGGTIADQTEYKISPDGGTTGVTVRTIQYVSDPSISSNPIPTPSGFTLIEIGYEDDSGFRLWTGKYAKGAGTIDSKVDTREGGKLIIYSITAIAVAPSTPAATIGGTVTLISANTRNGTDAANGTVVYDYVWAEGLGEISSETAYGQSSDEGTTGATVTTIKYLSALATAANPITPPASTVLIRVDYTMQDGYKIWTAIYAKGTGEVARDITYQQTSDGGTNGATLTTITHLTASTVSANPTSAPAGSTLIKLDHREADGWRIWTVAYGQGTGTVLSDVQTREGGKLILYRIIALGAAPSAPAATIGGTVTQIDAETRQSDGFAIYDYRWAEGLGEISRDIVYEQSIDQGTIGVTRTTIRYLSAVATVVNPITPPASTEEIQTTWQMQDGYKLWTSIYAAGVGLVLDLTDIQILGALVVYRRVALGSAPSAPAATIGGTVTLFETNVRKDNGYEVYDYRWAEGDGQSGIETRGEPDGALLYSVTTLNAGASTPAYPGSGTAYMISLEQVPQSGHFRNQAIYKKPPATQTRNQTIEWQKPGLASFTGTQLTLSPPATRTLLAEVEVTYSTSQLTTVPWEVEAYASFVFSYVTSALVGGAPSQTVSGQKGLAGYLSGATSVSGTNANYNGILCDSYSAVLVSSIPSSRPTGVTVLRVDNEPYLTATDGTVVWRRTKVSYDF